MESRGSFSSKVKSHISVVSDLRRPAASPCFHFQISIKRLLKIQKMLSYYWHFKKLPCFTKGSYAIPNGVACSEHRHSCDSQKVSSIDMCPNDTKNKVYDSQRHLWAFSVWFKSKCTLTVILVNVKGRLHFTGIAECS